MMKLQNHGNEFQRRKWFGVGLLAHEQFLLLASWLKLLFLAFLFLYLFLFFLTVCSLHVVSHWWTFISLKIKYLIQYIAAVTYGDALQVLSMCVYLKGKPDLWFSNNAAQINMESCCSLDFALLRMSIGHPFWFYSPAHIRFLLVALFKRLVTYLWF